MGLVANTPENATVKEIIEVEKQIGDYRITGIQITKDPNNEAAITVFVTWQIGYEDAGQFVAVDSRSAMLTAAELAPYLGPVEAVLKPNLWACLEANGYTPTGSVV